MNQKIKEYVDRIKTCFKMEDDPEELYAERIACNEQLLSTIIGEIAELGEGYFYD